VLPTPAVRRRSHEAPLYPVFPLTVPRPGREPSPNASAFGVNVAAQDAEVLHTAVSWTPEELTTPQLEAVVGSQTTTFARPDAAVANGTGVETTRGERLWVAIFTLKVLPAAVA
jgi:hypothetical protein